MTQSGPQPQRSITKRAESPRSKLLFALLTLALLTGAAPTQSKRFHDSFGKSIGSSSTDTQGTTTALPRGNVVARESRSGNITSVYDAAGGLWADDNDDAHASKETRPKCLLMQITNAASTVFLR